jgi:glycosyltransferase involved in cell wall biosynthesis
MTHFVDSISQGHGGGSNRRCAASVLILTRNEQHNIVDCVACLNFTDDIVVLDSCSTDRTVEMAAALKNVRVVQRAFDTEHAQRNFGLHGVPYRHRWVYVCDADERVPPQLAAEIARVCCDPGTTHAACRLRYQLVFEKRWIKHASGYPVWITRLLQPARVRYEDRRTHVHPVVDGTIGVMQGHFIHHAMSGGLVRWLRNHNGYSSAEAMEAVKVRRLGFPRLSRFFSTNPSVRRRAFKNASYFLKWRSAWRLFYSLVMCRAWRDGAPGIRYATLIAIYEYWIAMKIDEQRTSGTACTCAIARRIDQDIDRLEAEASAGASRLSEPAPPVSSVIAWLCLPHRGWFRAKTEERSALPPVVRAYLGELLRREHGSSSFAASPGALAAECCQTARAALHDVPLRETSRAAVPLPADGNGECAGHAPSRLTP